MRLLVAGYLHDPEGIRSRLDPGGDLAWAVVTHDLRLLPSNPLGGRADALTGRIRRERFSDAGVVRGDEPLGIHLDLREASAPACLAEPVQVPLARAEELQEAQAPVPA